MGASVWARRRAYSAVALCWSEDDGGNVTVMHETVYILIPLRTHVCPQSYPLPEGVQVRTGALIVGPCTAFLTKDHIIHIINGVFWIDYYLSPSTIRIPLFTCTYRHSDRYHEN